MFTKVERFQNMFYFERNCTKNSIIQHITHRKQKCLEIYLKGSLPHRKPLNTTIFFLWRLKYIGLSNKTVQETGKLKI